MIAPSSPPQRQYIVLVPGCPPNLCKYIMYQSSCFLKQFRSLFCMVPVTWAPRTGPCLSVLYSHAHAGLDTWFDDSLPTADLQCTWSLLILTWFFGCIFTAMLLHNFHIKSWQLHTNLTSVFWFETVHIFCLGLCIFETCYWKGA